MFRVLTSHKKKKYKNLKGAKIPLKYHKGGPYEECSFPRLTDLSGKIADIFSFTFTLGQFGMLM